MFRRFRLAFDDHLQGFGFCGAAKRIVGGHHVVQLEMVGDKLINREFTFGDQLEGASEWCLYLPGPC